MISMTASMQWEWKEQPDHDGYYWFWCADLGKIISHLRDAKPKIRLVEVHSTYGDWQAPEGSNAKEVEEWSEDFNWTADLLDEEGYEVEKRELDDTRAQAWFVPIYLPNIDPAEQDRRVREERIRELKQELALLEGKR